MSDILLISAQPDEVLRQMGLARQEERIWFEHGLGLEANDPRLSTLCAAHEKLPNHVGARGIIIGGSAHSVYENAEWMRDLKHFIRRMESEGKVILGVCFGSQIVAEAFGGSVQKGEVGLEVGLVDIELTEAGKKDPLFESIDCAFSIYAYHTDGVTRLPPGGTILAKNAAYPYQAFAIGDRVRGVQFHPEIGRDRIEKALAHRRASLIDNRTLTEDRYKTILADLEIKPFEQTRRQILKNFYENFVMLDPASLPVAQDA